MHVRLRHPQDLMRPQRDRYRAVLLALEGRDAPTTARASGHRQASVQHRV